MARFALFVDGSNLYGSLKSMAIEVEDYENLYGYIFNEAHIAWANATRQTERISSELRRVYWYTVGSIDVRDLGHPVPQSMIRNAFNRDEEVHDWWLGLAGREHPELTGNALEDEAWSACLSDIQGWYEKKLDSLDNMRRFYQAIRIKTDLIDVIPRGHWKVNFLRKWVEEKGLDTALAVDMVALQDNYDVAVVVSGDADSIPSIDHLKNRNKHIASVEFVSGSQPDNKNRTFSSRLKEHADFVVRIYEMDLIRLKIGFRPR